MLSDTVKVALDDPELPSVFDTLLTEITGSGSSLTMVPVPLRAAP